MTSLAATIIILVLDLVPLKKAPYLLTINARGIQSDADILAVIKKHARYPRVKARNLVQDELDMIVELRTRSEAPLLEAVSRIEGVSRVSLVSHDGESII